MRLDQVALLLLEMANSISSLILIGLGLAVIYGMMRVINLAQGEFLMLGAYVALVTSRAGFDLWVGMLAAPLVVGLIGLGLERAVIRHLYGRPLETMLATWGLSLILVQVVTLIFGPITESLAAPLGSVEVGQYSFALYRILLMGVAAGIMVGIYLLFKHTRYGLWARATMANPSMAAAMGVNANRMFMGTFALGSALAGAGGALISPLVGVVPTMGLAFIARAFVTVIVGGPVILLGTASSAAVLGVTESSISYLSTPFFGQAALLALAIVIIRVLPHGISGVWRKGA